MAKIKFIGDPMGRPDGPNKDWVKFRAANPQTAELFGVRFALDAWMTVPDSSEWLKRYGKKLAANPHFVCEGMDEYKPAPTVDTSWAMNVQEPAKEVEFVEPGYEAKEAPAKPAEADPEEEAKAALKADAKARLAADKAAERLEKKAK